MIKKHIQKIICMGLLTVSLLGISSIGANAEWEKSSNNTWNYYNNGTLLKNTWIRDSNSSKVYYLDSTGSMSTGWLSANGTWYYFYSDGSLAANTTINGFAVGADGAWTFKTPSTIINPIVIDSTQTENTNKATVTNKPKAIKVNTLDDLEEYLDENYSSLKTPIGTLKFSFNTMENDDKMFPCDFWIETDWGDIEDSKYDLDFFNPSDLTDSIKISDDDKEKTKELLKEYQENIAKVSIKHFPKKKIRGGFYSGFYKYQYIRTGYESVQFYSWRNYDVDLSSYKNYMDEYNHSNLSDFQWDNTDDTYDLD